MDESFFFLLSNKLLYHVTLVTVSPSLVLSLVFNLHKCMVYHPLRGKIALINCTQAIVQVGIGQPDFSSNPNTSLSLSLTHIHKRWAPPLPSPREFRNVHGPKSMYQNVLHRDVHIEECYAETTPSQNVWTFLDILYKQERCNMRRQEAGTPTVPLPSVFKGWIRRGQVSFLLSYYPTTWRTSISSSLLVYALCHFPSPL